MFGHAIYLNKTFVAKWSLDSFICICCVSPYPAAKIQCWCISCICMHLYICSYLTQKQKNTTLHKKDTESCKWTSMNAYNCRIAFEEQISYHEFRSNIEDIWGSINLFLAYKWWLIYIVDIFSLLNSLQIHTENTLIRL